MVYLDQNCWDGQQSDMSNLTITVNESYGNELQTEFSIMPQYLAMSPHSLIAGTPKLIREWLTALPQDSPVNHTVSPEKDLGEKTSATCGPKPENVFALYDLSMHYWKTLQVSCMQELTNEHTSDEYLESYPKSGTMHNGILYLRQASEHHTSEKESGFLPTPNAGDVRGPTNEYDPKAKCQSRRSLSTYASHFPTPRAKESGDYQYSRGDHSKKTLTLTGFVKTYPTPTAHMAKETNAPSEAKRHEPTLSSIVGGQLNPDWVEWLMNWPINWTRLEKLSNEHFERWKKASTAQIQGTGDVRDMWFYEEAIPRVATNIPYRAHRLKAIGNGQVPICMAVAWRILTEGIV